MILLGQPLLTPRDLVGTQRARKQPEWLRRSAVNKKLGHGWPLCWEKIMKCCPMSTTAPIVSNHANRLYRLQGSSRKWSHRERRFGGETAKPVGVAQRNELPQVDKEHQSGNQAGVGSAKQKHYNHASHHPEYSDSAGRTPVHFCAQWWSRWPERQQGQLESRTALGCVEFRIVTGSRQAAFSGPVSQSHNQRRPAGDAQPAISRSGE